MRKIFSFIYQNGLFVFLGIGLVGALIFTFVLGFSDFGIVEFEFTSLCEILMATIAALLGVAITIYIFLNDALQTQKADNPYMKKTIDSLLRKNRIYLIVNCILGFIVLVYCILIYESNLFGKATLCFLAAGSCFSISLLVGFNISIINHNQTLLSKAMSLLRKFDGNISPVSPVVITDTQLAVFFKETADVQKIVERVIDNHSKQTIGTPNDRKLASILTAKGGVGQAEAESLSCNYIRLIDHRDLLLVVIELAKKTDSVTVPIPIGFPNQIMRAFVMRYMKNELITDSSFTALNFDDVAFEGTSFAGCLLTQVTFSTGDMRNASFEGGQLRQTDFGACLTKGINFTRAVLNIQFRENAEFKFCNFTEADFSKQETMNNVSFDWSTFIRANFINEKQRFEMKNVSFQSTLCSMTKFVNMLMTEVCFNNASLTEAEFSSAKLTNCQLENANLEDATFFNAVISYTNLRGSRLGKANFFNAGFIDCDLHACFGAKVSFRHCTIKGSETKFQYSVLTEADFSSAVLSSASFVSATFTKGLFIRTKADNVCFQNAIFIDAQFSDDKDNPFGEYNHCDFSDAIFDNAIFSCVKFISCNFSGSSFRGAILKNVQFCQCEGLFQECFARAELDPFTIDSLAQCSGLQFDRVNYSNTQATQLKHSAVMSVEDAIHTRRSIRKFQESFPLNRVTIDKLIEAARWAPSTKNCQPWLFTVVDNSDVIAEISQFLPETAAAISQEGQESPASVGASASAMKSASAVVFISCTHIPTSGSLAGPTIQSIGAAIENMALQATALGLDTLWLCDVLEAHDRIKDRLNLAYGFLAAILIGKRADASGVNRKDIDEIRIWYEDEPNEGVPVS